jgi:Zn-dependent M32 family carboxypeptidase
MNKILNDKKDQISQLVEAAQARCTSNEKTTSTKKSQYQQEIMNNLSSNGKQSIPTNLSQFDLNSANHQYAQQVQQQARMQISSFQ